jgi:hypothetical protein
MRPSDFSVSDVEFSACGTTRLAKGSVQSIYQFNDTCNILTQFFIFIIGISLTLSQVNAYQ